ncbi:hypothetical protein BC567DRAFT_213870 [Phyllosticta citribraziliensis]
MGRESRRRPAAILHNLRQRGATRRDPVGRNFRTNSHTAISRTRHIHGRVLCDQGIGVKIVVKRAVPPVGDMADQDGAVNSEFDRRRGPKPLEKPSKFRRWGSSEIFNLLGNNSGQIRRNGPRALFSMPQPPPIGHIPAARKESAGGPVGKSPRPEKPP